MTKVNRTTKAISGVDLPLKGPDRVEVALAALEGAALSQTQIQRLKTLLNHEAPPADAASATKSEKPVDDSPAVKVNIIGLLKSTYFSRYPLIAKDTTLADAIAEVSDIKASTARGYISNNQREGKAFSPAARTAMKAAIELLTERAIKRGRLNKEEAARITEAVDKALGSEEHAMIERDRRFVRRGEASNGSEVSCDNLFQKVVLIDRNQFFSDSERAGATEIIVENQFFSDSERAGATEIIVDKCYRPRV